MQYDTQRHKSADSAWPFSPLPSIPDPFPSHACVMTTTATNITTIATAAAAATTTIVTTIIPTPTTDLQLHWLAQELQQALYGGDAA